MLRRIIKLHQAVSDRFSESGRKSGIFSKSWTSSVACSSVIPDLDLMLSWSARTPYSVRNLTFAIDSALDINRCFAEIESMDIIVETLFMSERTFGLLESGRMADLMIYYGHARMHTLWNAEILTDNNLPDGWIRCISDEYQQEATTILRGGLQ